MLIKYGRGRMVFEEKAKARYIFLSLLGGLFLFFYETPYLLLFSIIAFFSGVFIRSTTIIDKIEMCVYVGYKILGISYIRCYFSIPETPYFEIRKYAATEGDMGYGVFLKGNDDYAIWSVDDKEEALTVINKVESFLEKEI